MKSSRTRTSGCSSNHSVHATFNQLVPGWQLKPLHLQQVGLRSVMQMGTSLRPHHVQMCPGTGGRPCGLQAAPPLCGVPHAGSQPCHALTLLAWGLGERSWVTRQGIHDKLTKVDQADGPAASFTQLCGSLRNCHIALGVCCNASKLHNQCWPPTHGCQLGSLPHDAPVVARAVHGGRAALPLTCSCLQEQEHAVVCVIAMRQ